MQINFDTSNRLPFGTIPDGGGFNASIREAGEIVAQSGGTPSIESIAGKISKLQSDLGIGSLKGRAGEMIGDKSLSQLIGNLDFKFITLKGRNDLSAETLTKLSTSVDALDRGIRGGAPAATLAKLIGDVETTLGGGASTGGTGTSPAGAAPLLTGSQPASGPKLPWENPTKGLIPQFTGRGFENAFAEPNSSTPRELGNSYQDLSRRLAKFEERLRFMPEDADKVPAEAREKIRTLLKDAYSIFQRDDNAPKISEAEAKMALGKLKEVNAILDKCGVAKPDLF